jgi:hypothetical protein
MQEEELRKRAAEWVERTTAEQGLPPKIEDPVVLRKVAFLFGWIDADGNPIEPVR